MPEPGWVRDPSGRYHQRYFDGARWTEHVADDYGRRGIDPIESIPRAGQPAGPPGPVTASGASVADGPSGSRATRLGLTASPRLLVGLSGSVVAVVAIVAMPWYRDLRVAQLGSPAATGVGVLGASYFESGWVVTLIAVFLTGATCVVSVSRTLWTAAVPVGLCTAWAVVGTIALKSDVPGLSFGYGFFAAVVGLVATTTAPLLPAGPGSSPPR